MWESFWVIRNVPYLDLMGYTCPKTSVHLTFLPFTVCMSNSLKAKKASMKNPILLDKYIRKYEIDDNSDLVIEDIGFIKFTKKTVIKICADKDIYMYTRNKMI